MVQLQPRTERPHHAVGLDAVHREATPRYRTEMPLGGAAAPRRSAGNGTGGSIDDPVDAGD